MKNRKTRIALKNILTTQISNIGNILEKILCGVCHFFKVSHRVCLAYVDGTLESEKVKTSLFQWGSSVILQVCLQRQLHDQRVIYLFF